MDNDVIAYRPQAIDSPPRLLAGTPAKEDSLWQLRQTEATRAVKVSYSYPSLEGSNSTVVPMQLLEPLGKPSVGTWDTQWL